MNGGYLVAIAGAMGRPRRVRRTSLRTNIIDNFQDNAGAPGRPVTAA
jgi:hypothetical protein